LSLKGIKKNTLTKFYMYLNVVLTNRYISMFIVWFQVHHRFVGSSSLGLYYYCLALCNGICIFYNWLCKVILMLYKLTYHLLICILDSSISNVSTQSIRTFLICIVIRNIFITLYDIIFITKTNFFNLPYLLNNLFFASFSFYNF
jgi:hypothetical protein